MSTQQKSPLPDKNGWLVEEVMTLEGIPVGEYFNVRTILWHILYSICVFQYKLCMLFQTSTLQFPKHNFEC